MKIMTMQQFLQNPTGPYSALFSIRGPIIESLNNKFNKLMNERNKDFKLNIFKNKEDYIFQFKIPSETYDPLVYDVVISFTALTKDMINDFTLNRYAIKLFSNSPNFTFTYAYVYNKDGILISFLKNKLGTIALTKPPKVKNPTETYGFEKSVYFALLYIKYNKYYNKNKINGLLISYNKDKMIREIKSSEDKLKDYNIAKAKDIQMKKENKKKSKLNEELFTEEIAKRGKSRTQRSIIRRVNMTHSMMKGQSGIARKLPPKKVRKNRKKSTSKDINNNEE